MWRLAEEVCEGPQGAAAMRLLLPSPQLKAALVACVESIPQSCRDIKAGAQGLVYHMVRATGPDLHMPFRGSFRLVQHGMATGQGPLRKDSRSWPVYIPRWKCCCSLPCLAPACCCHTASSGPPLFFSAGRIFRDVTPLPPTPYTVSVMLWRQFLHQRSSTTNHAVFITTLAGATTAGAGPPLLLRCSHPAPTALPCIAGRQAALNGPHTSPHACRAGDDMVAFISTAMGELASTGDAGRLRPTAADAEQGRDAQHLAQPGHPGGLLPHPPQHAKVPAY
jgi:hypothetical protein